VREEVLRCVQRDGGSIMGAAILRFGRTAGLSRPAYVAWRGTDSKILFGAVRFRLRAVCVGRGDMVDEQHKHDFRPEAYREYVWFLARLWMPRDLRRKMDPSDLVQDTLMKAYEKRVQFKGNTSGQYKAWLRRILRRILPDRVREYGRTPEQSAIEVEKSFRRLVAAFRAARWCVTERPG
jgi:hypothetical protein